MTGSGAISLWEEAAPLKRNRTGWDDPMEGVVAEKGFQGAERSWMVAWIRVALQVQVSAPPPSSSVCQPGLHCSNPH